MEHNIKALGGGGETMKDDGCDFSDRPANTTNKRGVVFKREKQETARIVCLRFIRETRISKFVKKNIKLLRWDWCVVDIQTAGKK